jgi:hypothetical protein
VQKASADSPLIADITFPQLIAINANAEASRLRQHLKELRTQPSMLCDLEFMPMLLKVLTRRHRI